MEHLDASGDMPDSVFVEDIAVVFDELAIITRPGATSRRVETPAVAAVLARHRPLHVIQAPGTADGGDVLVAGRHVFVGLSTRTNDHALGQMARVLQPYGYKVRGVRVRECLHLKSAVTALSDDLLLVNPAWIDRDAFDGFTMVEVDAGEPAAANALRLDDRILCSASFARTAARLERRGLRVERIATSEVAKAEGAMTCCSLILK